MSFKNGDKVIAVKHFPENGSGPGLEVGQVYTVYSCVTFDMERVVLYEQPARYPSSWFKPFSTIDILLERLQDV